MENIKVQKVKYSFKKVGVLFVVLGLILICVGSFLLIKNHLEKNDYLPVNATINKINKVYHSIDTSNHNDYTYDVLVIYNVDGKMYINIRLPFYSHNMKVGDTIEILYNVNDPTVIKTENSSIFTGVLLLTLGSVPFVVGVFIIKNELIKKKHLKELLNNYEQHRVEIINIENKLYKHNRTVTELNTCVLCCEYNGMMYKSKEFYKNEDVKIGYTVNLLFNKKALESGSLKKYHDDYYLIDLDSITKQKN